MNNKIDFYGKVAKFPKNTKAKNAYLYLENIKIPKKILWYFLIEKEVYINDEKQDELQIIKYNNNNNFNCSEFINHLKEYYKTNSEICKYVSELVIDGNDKFSIIRNIPDIEIDGKKLISIITEDLIKLLY
jgi:hypothetical protein